MKLIEHTVGPIHYFVSGSHPDLLLTSGVHGDEHGVITTLARFVETHARLLPSFLYIPQVSPSAVERGTRENKYGHDVNRQFVPETDDPEVLALMEILSKHRFTQSLDHHEDVDRESFYLYDSGQLAEPQLHRLRKDIRSTGVTLYSGIDDKALGFSVVDGYVSTPAQTLDPKFGFLDAWTGKHGITKRAATVEVPGRVPAWKNASLVERVASFFITSGV